MRVILTVDTREKEMNKSIKLGTIKWSLSPTSGHCHQPVVTVTNQWSLSPTSGHCSCYVTKSCVHVPTSTCRCGHMINKKINCHFLRGQLVSIYIIKALEGHIIKLLSQIPFTLLLITTAYHYS
jgi:hypothetical protein